MRTFVCPEAKEEERNGPPEREVRRAQGGDETVGVRTVCCFRKKATAGFSKEGGTFSPATCSIITTLESLMFDTWASYESTRAFVTSSFLLATLGPARRAGVCVASFRSLDHRTSARRTEGPSTHTPPSPPDGASPERGHPLAKLLVEKQSEVIECWYLLIERKSMAEKSGCTQIIIIALGICLGLALFGLCG